METDFRGWWYNNCGLSHLTGLHKGESADSCAYGSAVPDGIEWPSWKGAFYSAKVAQMKVRRIVDSEGEI